MKEKILIFLLLIFAVSIVNAIEYDSDWDTYNTTYYVNYTKSNISEVEHFIEWKYKDMNFSSPVMNITGNYGFREFICFPTNETTSFGSKVFDCEWTSEPKPTMEYEEAMYWTNLTEEEIVENLCNWWCKVKRFFRNLF